jgi:hypothetical protein
VGVEGDGVDEEASSEVCDWSKSREACSAGWAGGRDQSPCIGQYEACANNHPKCWRR